MDRQPAVERRHGAGRADQSRVGTAEGRSGRYPSASSCHRRRDRFRRGGRGSWPTVGRRSRCPPPRTGRSPWPPRGGFRRVRHRRAHRLRHDGGAHPGKNAPKPPSSPSSPFTRSGEPARPHDRSAASPLTPRTGGRRRFPRPPIGHRHPTGTGTGTGFGFGFGQLQERVERLRCPDRGGRVLPRR